jgi:hypothetical protein
MAALLDCSQQDVADFVIAAHELVGDSLAGLEAPAIPPFGLIPPTERVENEPHSEPGKEGDEPCD